MEPRGHLTVGPLECWPPGCRMGPTGLPGRRLHYGAAPSHSHNTLRFTSILVLPSSFDASHWYTPAWSRVTPSTYTCPPFDTIAGAPTSSAPPGAGLTGASGAAVGRRTPPRYHVYVMLSGLAWADTLRVTLACSVMSTVTGATDVKTGASGGTQQAPLTIDQLFYFFYYFIFF